MMVQKLSTVLRLIGYFIVFPLMVFSFVNYEYLGITANVFIGVYFFGRLSKGITSLKQALY